MDENILMAHGGGGSYSRALIKELIVEQLGNPILNSLEDSAYLDISERLWNDERRVSTGDSFGKNDKNIRLAFTTDSFVVTPPFFPGGDIGRLAVAGTVNDLAAAGARPYYLSLALIIEEGFKSVDLDMIIKSISETITEIGVKVVTGDTKVVEKGKGDGIYINTAGIGIVPGKVNTSVNLVQPGDQIIINGGIAEHGLAVISEREGLGFKSSITSDVAPLSNLVQNVLDECGPGSIRALRDPTRGGLAATLNEIAISGNCQLEIEESKIPIRDDVAMGCEMLGYDPFYIANEGKLIFVVPSDYSEQVLEVIRGHKYGHNGTIIGKVETGISGRVLLKTKIGGQRILDMPYGDQLPRIC